MDRLKVLYVTTSYPMQINPASGIFIHRLISHMPEHVDSSVLTPQTDSGGFLLTDGKNIKVKTFRYWFKKSQKIAHKPGGIPVALRNNKFLYLLLPFFLISEFLSTLRNSFHTQIIHANWSINGLIAGIVGIITGKPVVTTLRGEDITRAKKYKIDQFILRYCIKWSSMVACVNNSYKEWILKVFPQAVGKIITIENGVDQRFYKIGTNRYISNLRPNQVLRLLVVGSIIERKRTQDIVKALINLRDPKISLTIAGDGPEIDKIRELVNTNKLNTQVELVGTVDPESLLVLLKTHDAFVICSESEGRPNSLLEAMAAGLPVISTKLPGITEIVTHNFNGLLYDVGNINTLQENVVSLKENIELRKTLGKAAHVYMISHNLTWQNTACKYVELYQSLVTEQQGTS
jgi:glycosyltransferase involved in cell wall biosynthesis